MLSPHLNSIWNRVFEGESGIGEHLALCNTFLGQRNKMIIDSSVGRLRCSINSLEVPSPRKSWESTLQNGSWKSTRPGTREEKQHIPPESCTLCPGHLKSKLFGTPGKGFLGFLPFFYLQMFSRPSRDLPHWWVCLLHGKCCAWLLGHGNSSLPSRTRRGINSRISLWFIF